MKDIITNLTEQFRQRHREARRYVAMLLVLALVTTLFVNWQLHGVGISMTADYHCGYEEHQHTEACYEKVLTCGYEEGEPKTRRLPACRRKRTWIPILVWMQNRSMNCRPRPFWCRTSIPMRAMRNSRS